MKLFYKNKAAFFLMLCILFFLPAKLSSFTEPAKSDSLLSILNETTDSVSRLEIYKSLSDYWELQNVDTAKYYANKALDKAKWLNDSLEIASIYNHLGILCIHVGDNQQAMYYLQKSLAIAKRNNFENIKARSYINIGAVFNNEENYDSALEHYYKALEINRTINDKLGMADDMNNIAVTYRRLGDFEKAIQYFNKSYNLYKQLDDLSGMANTYNNIAIIYFQTNRINMALQAFEKCAQIRKELGQYLEYGNVLFNISFVLEHLGEYEQAKEKAYMGLKQAKATTNLPLQRVCYLKLVDIYRNLGDFEQAYKHHKEFFVIADSLFNINKQEKLIELKSQYNVEKERYEIELLEKENELMKNNIKRLNYYLASAGAVFALLLGLSIMIYNNNRGRTKRNKIIEQRNNLIEKQKDEYAAQSEKIRLYNEKLNAKQKEIIKQKELLENRAHALEKAVRSLEEKNEKIKSSLRYAGRLQEAMTTNVDPLHQCFSNVFLYRKQKHEVFNCFHWIYNNENYCLMAIVDNHNDGVSGAFIMILINDLLNKYAKNNDDLDVKYLIDSIESGIYSPSEEDTNYLADAFENISLNIVKIDLKSLDAFYIGKDSPFMHVCRGNSNLINPAKTGKASKYYEGNLSLNKNDLLLLANYYALKYFLNKDEILKTEAIKTLNFDEKGVSKDEYKTIRSFMDDQVANEPPKDDIFLLGVKI